MRLLKKLIRKLYHLIWFLSVFLIFTPSVFAVTGNPNTNGTEFITPAAVTFYDNTNESLTAVTTSFNNTGKYYSADLVYNGADTAGANVNLTLLEPIQSGYTYSLVILVGSSVHFKVSTKKVCIAENATNTVVRWHNDWCVTPTFTDQMGGVNFNVVDSSFSNTISYTALYYIFTSNVTARAVNVAFNSSMGPASSTTVLGGYKLTLLSDNSGLTSTQLQSAINSAGVAKAQDVQELESAIDEIPAWIDGVQQRQNQTNEKLDDVNDNLTDETAPQFDLSDLEVSSDTPISDLITMPLTILNTLVQTLDGSCTNYTIPFFYDSTLTFPCFTISDYLGSTVTNYIDLFICFYMCYNIAMLVISVFEDVTSLRDIYDSMYVPKHADTGYQPRHAKGGGN